MPTESLIFNQIVGWRLKNEINRINYDQQKAELVVRGILHPYAQGIMEQLEVSNKLDVIYEDSAARPPVLRRQRIGLEAYLYLRREEHERHRSSHRKLSLALRTAIAVRELAGRGSVYAADPYRCNPHTNLELAGLVDFGLSAASVADAVKIAKSVLAHGAEQEAIRSARIKDEELRRRIISTKTTQFRHFADLLLQDETGEAVIRQSASNEMDYLIGVLTPETGEEIDHRYVPLFAKAGLLLAVDYYVRLYNQTDSTISKVA